MPGQKMSKILKIVIIVAVILLIAGGACFAVWRAGYVKTWQIARQLQKQQQASVADQAILTQLKKFIFLPENVTPTMAVIKDAEVLKKQQPVFFSNAKNGDHLIIYPDMAIIYDAEAKKIMKVGPVQTAMPVAATSTTPVETSEETN